MDTAVHVLPHVNASLNGLAALLLVLGYLLILQRREAAHKYTMLACFGVSMLFLTCYVLHKVLKGMLSGDVNTSFPAYPHDAIRYTYYFILITHVVLAAAVPFLAMTTIYFGLRDNRYRHVALARWTFPIWLYVSVTGVIVYMMLYHLYPPVE